MQRAQYCWKQDHKYKTKTKFQMALTLQRVIRSLSYLVLGWGFRGQCLYLSAEKNSSCVMPTCSGLNYDIMQGRGYNDVTQG